MKQNPPHPIDYEDIPFILDASLSADSGKPTDEEIMLIAVSLFEMVPPDRDAESTWVRAARLEGVGRRTVISKEKRVS